MITIQQVIFACGIVGLISFILNIVFIIILSRFGKPVWEQMRAKKMKNPTYVCLVHNKNRITEELMDFNDGIIKIGKKTYIKHPERILKCKPFDKAYFMAEDCRPLNLADLELILDPEVYTRQLELAEMAGSAKMIERLIEELMKVLTPYLIAMIVAVVICVIGLFVLGQQHTEQIKLMKEIMNVTVSAIKINTQVIV